MTWRRYVVRRCDEAGTVLDKKKQLTWDVVDQERSKPFAPWVVANYDGQRAARAEAKKRNDTHAVYLKLADRVITNSNWEYLVPAYTAGDGESSAAFLAVGMLMELRKTGDTSEVSLDELKAAALQALKQRAEAK